MATSLDINDLVRIFQDSNLCDEATKQKLNKLKNESNKWQNEIYQIWANLKIPVYNKSDIRLLNDAAYNTVKRMNIARGQLRDYYLRNNNLQAAVDLPDLMETSKSGKNCTMVDGKLTLGWDPGIQRWITIENDSKSISISDFQNCIEVCQFTSALNIPMSLEKLLKEAEFRGLSENQIRDLLLDFVKDFKPASVLTARTFASTANELIQFLISLVNTPAEVQKVREALKKVSRETNSELIDVILKIKSLTSSLLLLNNPKADRQKIEKRSGNAAIDAIFDFVNPQVQEGLRIFKQRCSETDREISINSMVSEVLRLEHKYGRPTENKFVSQKIQHTDSLSSYFTNDRQYRGRERSRDRQSSPQRKRNMQSSDYGRSNSRNRNSPANRSYKSNEKRFSSSRERSYSRGKDRNQSYNRSQPYERRGTPRRDRSFSSERGGHSRRNSGSYDRMREYRRQSQENRRQSPRRSDERTDKGRGHPEKTSNCCRCNSKNHISNNCPRYPFFTANSCSFCGFNHPDDMCRFKDKTRYITPDKQFADSKN